MVCVISNFWDILIIYMHKINGQMDGLGFNIDNWVGLVGVISTLLNGFKLVIMF